MKKKYFDSVLYDVFHELQVDSEVMDQIILRISENPKIGKMLDEHGINKITTRQEFINWCKVISENLEDNKLRELVEKIKIQENKLNLDIF